MAVSSRIEARVLVPGILVSGLCLAAVLLASLGVVTDFERRRVKGHLNVFRHFKLVTRGSRNSFDMGLTYSIQTRKGGVRQNRSAT